MTATIQTIQKPTRARALDTSTSIQESKEMITDGNFPDSTNWSLGDDWTIGSNKATCTNDAGDNNGNLIQYHFSGSFVKGYGDQEHYEPGVTYRCTYTVSDYDNHSSGSSSFRFLLYSNTYSDYGNGTEKVWVGLGTSRTANGTYTEDITISYNGGSNENQTFIQTNNDPITVSISNLSIRKLESFGNNNHGQIYSGRGLEFDGVTDNLQIVGAPGSSSEIAGVNSFDEGVAYSWCTWIYLNSHSNTKNWFLGNGVTNPQIRIIEADGRLSIREDASAAYYYISSTGLKLKTWYRLVITADTSNNLKCYLNGVLDNTLSEGDSPWSGSGTFGVGGSNLGTQFQMVCLGSSYLSGGNQYPLDGMLSDFQIWDTTLTADDVLYDYNNPEQLALNRGGTSLTNSNLKVWYPMNDGHRGQQSYILDASNTGLGDELVSNGDFSVDSDSLWLTGTDGNGVEGWSISGGNATKVAAVNSGIEQSNIFEQNKIYKVVFTISERTVGSIALYVGQGTQLIYSNGSSEMNGTHTRYFKSTTTQHKILFNGTDNFNGNIDDVSIRAVNNKNHATTVFYGDEMITDTQDRDFSAALGSGDTDCHWTAFDPDSSSVATVVSIDSARLKTVTTTEASDEREGCEIALSNITTLVAGRTYRVTCDMQATSAGFTLTVGMGGASTTQAITTSDATYNIDITVANAVGSLRFYTTENTARTWHMDNISIKEVGTASGWTDADQQLDIPQTALQSYDQLAWFDGVADCMTISDHGDFTFGTGSDDTPFSVSAWVFIGEASATGTGGGIVAKYSSGQAEWSLSLLDGYIRFYTYDQSETAHIGTKTDSRAEVGKWLHVVGTYSGNENSSGFKIYINGEEITSSDYTGGSGYAAMDNQSSDVKIGEHSTDFLLGSVTEVSIFGNREIGQNTVNELYNDGKALDARDCSAKSYLVGYWRNNGLATWTNVHNPGTHDGSPTSLTETMLITAGVDGSRDSQGFIMNRQRATNSLNLYENGGDTSHGPLVEVLDKPENSTGNFDSTGDGLGDFTIEFWLKGSGVASNNMILIQSVYKDGSDNYSGFDINMDASDGEIRCHYYKGSGSDTETWSFSGSNGAVNFYDNEWHHYVMVVKRTGGGPAVHTIIDKICRDKVSGTPLSNVSSIKAFLSSIKIGGRDYNIVQGSMTNRQPFSGQLDDIKIYKKALTAWESDGSSLEEGDTVTSGEVLRNYNAGKRSHR